MIERKSPVLWILQRLIHLTAEDNMNVQLKDITVVARDGRVSHLDQVYIRGSHVRFFIVPDMLR
jgi:small nuclear ribonucleoprotein D3